MNSTRAGTAIAAVVAVAAAVVWAVCGGQVRLPQAGKPVVSKAVKRTAPGPVQPAVRKVKTQMNFGPWAKYPGTQPGAKWSCTLYVDLMNYNEDPFGTDGAFKSSGAASCSITGYGRFHWPSPEGEAPSAANLPAEWTAGAKQAWLDWYNLNPGLNISEYYGIVFVGTAKVGTEAQYQYLCHGWITTLPNGPRTHYGPTEWTLTASIEGTPIQAQARVGDASYTKRTSPRRWTDREAQFGITSPEDSAMTAVLGSMSVSAAANTADINTLNLGLSSANAPALGKVNTEIQGVSVSNALVPCDFSTLHQWALLDHTYVYATSQPENAYSHLYGTSGGTLQFDALAPNGGLPNSNGMVCGGAIRVIHEALVKPVVHAAWWAPESGLTLPAGARFDLGIEQCTGLDEEGEPIWETVWFPA